MLLYVERFVILVPPELEYALKHVPFTELCVCVCVCVCVHMYMHLQHCAVLVMYLQC